MKRPCEVRRREMEDANVFIPDKRFSVAGKFDEVSPILRKRENMLFFPDAHFGVGSHTFCHHHKNVTKLTTASTCITLHHTDQTANHLPLVPPSVVF